MNKRFSDKDVLNIVSLYCHERISIDNIAKRYNSSFNTIKNILLDKDIQIRTKSDARKEYTINEEYFDVIDTNNKAYVLGLLYADGNIHSKRNMIQIFLQENDKEILEKIIVDMEYSRGLYYKDYSNSNFKRKNQYGIVITNKKLKESLIAQGCVPKKSLILKFPENLDKRLYPHFIRGYLDGDGCIYYDGCRSKVSFYSTIDFCNFIKEIVLETLDLNVYITKRNEFQADAAIGGTRNIIKFLNWIYNDADLFLYRKYEKYLQILNYYNSFSHAA